MTRVEIERTNKLKRKTYWKEFRRNFIKKYLKFLSYVGLALIGVIAFMHLWVGASNQAHDKYNSIRDNNYTEMR